MAEDIFVTVHLTLNQKNIANAEQVLERLAKFNVTSLSMTSSDASLGDTFDSSARQSRSTGADAPV